MPTDIKVHWDGADSIDEAALGLALFARRTSKRSESGQTILVVTSSNGLKGKLIERLERFSVHYQVIDLDKLVHDPSQLIHGQYCAVVAGLVATNEITQLGKLLIDLPSVSEIPFEYASGLDERDLQFDEWDEYRDTRFVSPLLSDDLPIYDIYRESLQLFEQKCGFRDYLDVYQLLRHLEVNEVPGAICEFGSFRGHSGWLMASLLKAMGSNRQIYLFDAFSSFPEESLGIDGFWSGTHHVDFEEVKRKFERFDTVQFVQGDFTETCLSQGPEQIALAYVDCDSYRATRSLVGSLWEQRVVSRGVMAFEDYGHPALLGNRLAVNQCAREDGIQGFEFFSQFSGIYAVVKMQ